MNPNILIELTEKESFMNVMKERFCKNVHRHPLLNWQDIATILESKPETLLVLNAMELTGGEPDVVVLDVRPHEVCFVDCAAESPKGRRSLCYDRKALESRKEFKPVNTVLDMAGELNVTVLNEEEYRSLQRLDVFDLKTSSWIKTPDEIRNLGGSLFCDRRYNAVFTYHNGADSYYSSRGFRGLLKIE